MIYAEHYVLPGCNFQGCYLQVNGKCILVKGAVLVMLADTLAAHSIGGFKVGIGFALRQCRNCLATKEMLSTKVCAMHIFCDMTIVMCV